MEGEVMDNRPVSYAKLDSYDYAFIYADNEIKQIVVYVGSKHDIDIADIASDITASDGNIYVEGHYFRFIEMLPPVDTDNPMVTIVVQEI